MKRLISILLLAILFLNWFGYRLVISFIENKADKQLETRLDNNNYDESQLVSIKIPAINFSYYTNSKFFERVNGQIELFGIQYKYVKRRLFNDSLELICIPNQIAMKLCNAKNEFFKIVNDIQPKENRKGGPNISINMSTDFLKGSRQALESNLESALSSWEHYFQDVPTSYFPLVIENPPECMPI